jgi:hypothetical protein
MEKDERCLGSQGLSKGEAQHAKEKPSAKAGDDQDIGERVAEDDQARQQRPPERAVRALLGTRAAAGRAARATRAQTDGRTTSGRPATARSPQLDDLEINPREFVGRRQ